MTSLFAVLPVILLLLTALEKTSTTTLKVTNGLTKEETETNAVLAVNASKRALAHGEFHREDPHAANDQDNEKQVRRASALIVNKWSSYQQHDGYNVNVLGTVIAGPRLQIQKAEVSDTGRHLEGRHLDMRHLDWNHLDDLRHTEDSSGKIKSERYDRKLFFKRSISANEEYEKTVTSWNDREFTGTLENSSVVITEREVSHSDFGNEKQKYISITGTQRRNTGQPTVASSSRKNSSISTEFPEDLLSPSRTTQMMSGSESRELGCRFGMNERRLLSISDLTYDRITCFWCYVFVPKHRKKESLALDFRNHRLLYNNHSLAFDRENGTTWQIIRESMIDDLEARKLETCCKEAIQCCDTMLQGSPSHGPAGDCPPTWDGWTCVPKPAPSLHSVKVQCPVHAYTGYPECYMTGEKRCGEDGVWQTHNGYEFTNYTGCSMEDFHQLNYIWELTMHAISLAALVPALLVLCCFRALRLPRFRMHVNFFTALSLRALFKILELAVIKMPENLNKSNILEDNGIACKVMVTLSKVALLSVWGWMLAESIFLHRLISRPFSRVTTILPYVGGAWGGAAVIGVSWAVCRALLEDFQCWLGDRKGDALQLHLVTDVPILISLLINIGLLIDMGRIMFLQLRGRNADQSDVNKRAVKGTLFLVPMFGAQFLLTAVAPIGVHCSWLQGYLMISSAMTGLQGFYITIFYCYNNKEVQKQLRLTTRRLQHRMYPSTLGTSGPTDRRWGDSSAADPQTTMSTVMSENSTARGGEGTEVEMQPLRR